MMDQLFEWTIAAESADGMPQVILAVSNSMLIFLSP
jgi:hypothetical protein